jgi:ADP-heptose:LPS heptosyltransferase
MGIGGDFFISAAVNEIKKKKNKKIFVTSKNIINFIQSKLGIFIYIPFPTQDIFKYNKLISSGFVKKGDIVINRSNEKISYASKELRDKYIFKNQKKKHAVSIICNFFGVSNDTNKPKIFFSEDEILKYEKKFSDLKNNFIIIEPNVKSGFLGSNRAWPFHKWQNLINKNAKKVNFIQVGDGKGKDLVNLYKNFNGKLTIRETIYLIKKAFGFLGTDSGLMHAARAVETKSLILYHQINSVELIGYHCNKNLLLPDLNCKYCGYKENFCPNNNKCMDFDEEFVEQSFCDFIKNL